MFRFLDQILPHNLFCQNMGISKVFFFQINFNTASLWFNLVPAMYVIFKLFEIL